MATKRALRTGVGIVLMAGILQTAEAQAVRAPGETPIETPAETPADTSPQPDVSAPPQTVPPAPVAPVPAAEPSPPPVQDIVVTGTLFRGTRPNGAALVQVLNSDDLIKQGSPTLVNLAKNITANQASLGESNRFLGEAGLATVNLRGFGANRTLVLFNGRRMAFAPVVLQPDVVDINFIPMVAVGRIEVLKEGAAATYGSDAIAGVMNFITRRDLDAFESTQIIPPFANPMAITSFPGPSERSSIAPTYCWPHRTDTVVNCAPWSAIGRSVLIPRRRWGDGPSRAIRAYS